MIAYLQLALKKCTQLHTILHAQCTIKIRKMIDLKYVKREDDKKYLNGGVRERGQRHGKKG